MKKYCKWLTEKEKNDGHFQKSTKEMLNHILRHDTLLRITLEGRIL